MKVSKPLSSPMIGGSSLLVIFAVLCLTTFALLGLSTVQADERLNDTCVRAVTEYYEADLQAERIFAQLRESARNQDPLNGNPLNNDSLPDGVTVAGNVYSYQCVISDTQVLDVQIEKKGNDWTVLQWQARTCE